MIQSLKQMKLRIYNSEKEFNYIRKNLSLLIKIFIQNLLIFLII